MRLIGVLIVFWLFGCQVKPAVQLVSVEDLDYSRLSYWAAHPAKHDSADLVPAEVFDDRQDSSVADVFFLHPTTYVGKKAERYWNGPVDDRSLNRRTDETTIRHQASIFNGVGKVYAPRYRQAHLHVYFNKRDFDKVRDAFELAYRDVRNAFLQYLEHWNLGRPIILASHSQGSTHAERLIKEFFDGTQLQDQLVAAYLVGMPIRKGTFKSIVPCQDENAFHCFCSWRTFKAGYVPKKRVTGDSIAVTNPLNWKTTSEYAPPELNQGGVLRNYHAGIRAGLTDAKIINGLLWAKKPKFPGSFLMTFRNYHVADYNLYWANVRSNARLRLTEYLRSH